MIFRTFWEVKAMRGLMDDGIAIWEDGGGKWILVNEFQRLPSVGRF